MIYSVVKRIIDVLLSLLALIVLFPVLLIAIVGIYISSPGPVLFKAIRVGKGGRLFKMYKFRSMHLNNEKGHMITLRTDNRIFPFGRFIRKAKIDELPQLVNILQGKMSIVGWRPEDEENVKKVFVGKYREVLSIKPGLTSPGSLYDYTHGEKYEDEELYEKEFLPKKMDLELYYVRHRSLGYDARLIGRTIKTIVQVVFGKEDFAEPKELLLKEMV
jgi:putative colanic acid biosynthesis UDP-glucose lipid carrier transferase